MVHGQLLVRNERIDSIDELLILDYRFSPLNLTISKNPADIEHARRTDNCTEGRTQTLRHLSPL